MRVDETLGTSPKKLNKCMGARRFVLRIVPDFSYLFGLPALLHDRAQLNKKKPALLQSVPRQLGRCVRLGFNSHEKSALYQILIKSRISRRQLHQKFESLKSYIPTTKPNETWDQTLERVRDGLRKERNAK
jgi:hypothetical protein